MKNRILLCTSISVLLLSSCLVGCGGNTSSSSEEIISSSEEIPSSITLETFNEPLDIHTDIQNTFLSISDPALQDKSIDGKSELSRPKGVTLSWEDSIECPSYSVMISENEDMSNSKRYFTSDKEIELYNLKIATTYYWKVIQSVKDGQVSKIGSFETIGEGPRNLYVDGVTNFRDMGGWMTSSGTRMNQGILYRGARLNNSYSTGFDKDSKIRDEYCVVEPEITEDGEKVFTDDLKIKTEIDLRDTNGNGYPGGGIPGSVDQAPTIGSVVDGVTYIAIPMDNSATIEDNKEEIKEFFEVLANKDNYPIYYHCNIGTNRTGMVSYLIGALCGMSQHDLELDYMFSNLGTIALPTPLSSNRKRTELIELTGEYEKNTYGASYVVNSFEGNNLIEKAENCLKDCGVSQETIDAVRKIMMD